MSLYTDGEICSGCFYAVFHTCGDCLKECKIGAERERSRIHGDCPKHTARPYNIEDYVEIRGTKYEKVKMDEAEFARFYDNYREEIRNGDIRVKLSKTRDVCGVRKKDNGNYKVLPPAGFDPTAFARTAYDVDSIDYFYIHYKNRGREEEKE